MISSYSPLYAPAAKRGARTSALTASCPSVRIAAFDSQNVAKRLLRSRYREAPRPLPAAMEAAVSEGLKLGSTAIKEAIGRLYFDRDQPAEAVKLLTEAYAAAKRIDGTEAPPLALPDPATAGQLADACRSVCVVVALPS